MSGVVKLAFFMCLFANLATGSKVVESIAYKLWCNHQCSNTTAPRDLYEVRDCDQFKTYLTNHVQILHLGCPTAKFESAFQNELFCQRNETLSLSIMEKSCENGTQLGQPKLESTTRKHSNIVGRSRLLLSTIKRKPIPIHKDCESQLCNCWIAPWIVAAIGVITMGSVAISYNNRIKRERRSSLNKNLG